MSFKCIEVAKKSDQTMDKEELEKLFDACDTNGKGYLDRIEFGRLCVELSLRDDEFHALFETMDTNSDDRIQKSEFVAKFHVVAKLFFDAIEQNNDTEQVDFQEDGRCGSNVCDPTVCDEAEQYQAFGSSSEHELVNATGAIAENNDATMCYDVIGGDAISPRRDLSQNAESLPAQSPSATNHSDCLMGSPISPRKTSTPLPPTEARRHRSSRRAGSKLRIVKKSSSWDRFTEAVGHIIYALPSYDSICSLYNLLDEQGHSEVVASFEHMMNHLLQDIGKLQGSIADLESSLQRASERSSEQLLLLEEEMEAQISIKEEKAREEERTRLEGEANLMKMKYEEKIGQLQEAVAKLRKVDERLSKSAPLETEIEQLRGKLYELTAENSNLRTKLEEAETQTILLQSQISSLNADLHEKRVVDSRDNDVVMMALSGHENMTQQMHTLTTTNRKLRDSHDDLREVLESQMTAYRKLSRLSRASPSASTSGDFMSPFSSAPHSRLEIPIGTSGRSSRNSMYESDILAQCDPQLSSIICEEGATEDETEADFSFSTSVDGAAPHTNNGFERDSGVGTYKDEQGSDLDLESGRHYRSRFSISPVREGSASSSSGRRHHPRRSKFNGLSDVTDEDDDTMDYDVKEKRKKYEQQFERKRSSRRKVVRPQLVIPDQLFKVILCGDMSVGKSSFIFRACKNKFTPHTRSTLGVDFQQLTVTLDACQVVTLQLWDTAGQERFRSISSSYFRRADGVILVYDVTNADTFLSVREWMDTISGSTAEGTPVLICGNKVDLREERDTKEIVTQTEGAQLAANYGVLFMECSAASGQNVQGALTLLTRHLASRSSQQQEECGSIRDLHKATTKDDSKCCLKT